MLHLKDGFTGERTIILPMVIQEMIEEDPVISSLYVTDIGYYPKAKYHYRERNESIDQYVLIYCTDGAGWYKFDGRKYEVEADQYFILPPGKPHIYAASSSRPWTIYWIHFKGNMASAYAPDSFDPQDIKPGKNSRMRERIDIFEDLYYTLDNGYSLDNLRYATSLLHYFLASLKYLQQFRRAQDETSADDSTVQTAIHLMKERLEQKLSLSDIAESVGYSPTHFSLIFKNRTGHSPLAYYNLLKIQTACRLLDETDMRINQIALKLGIEDNYYFSRLFSKTMGMSPKEYRNRVKT